MARRRHRGIAICAGLLILAACAVPVYATSIPVSRFGLEISGAGSILSKFELPKYTSAGAIITTSIPVVGPATVARDLSWPVAAESGTLTLISLGLVLIIVRVLAYRRLHH